MSSIYVISCPMFQNQIYKVGSHDSTLKRLISRYITSFPYLNVHYFIHIKDAHDVESIFKEKYRSYRIANMNNRLSEWVTMPLEDIINGLLEIIQQLTNSTLYYYKYKETWVISDDQDKINQYNKCSLKQNLADIVQVDDDEIVHNLGDHIRATMNLCPTTTQQMAINKFFELINVSNLFISRWIPHGIESCFHHKANEINEKLESCVIIYYDTRFFVRQPGEPECKMQISDRCHETAILCSDTFGFHSKTINTVATANKIFVTMLMKYFNASIITGKCYDQCWYGQRIRFTPYLICLKKEYYEMANKETEKYKAIVKLQEINFDDITVNTKCSQKLEQNTMDTNIKCSSELKINCKDVPCGSEVKGINPKLERQDINSDDAIADTNLKKGNQINPLELLVEFALRYHQNVYPQHLVNRIRENGYHKAFRSLRIKTTPITTEIDKYLKSLKIPGLRWKLLKIKPDTLFPNVKTKYD